MQRISFEVTHATLASLMDAAQRDDVPVGQILRDAVRRELRRLHACPATAEGADERCVAQLAARLAPVFGAADSWEHLAQLLGSHGLEVRPAGGGLAVHELNGGQRVCKASDLGHSYARLIRQFGAPFPGHAHRHLVERVLGRAGVVHEDDVFEPFEPTGNHPQPRAADCP